MIKMIALDLDGTLLDERKTVTPRTRAALEEAAGRGVTIVPATGRALCGIPAAVESIAGVRYILTSNGAAVCERGTGKIVCENRMSLERVLPMMERLEPLNLMADAFVGGKCYMKRKNRHLIEKMDVSEELREYIRTSRTCVENVTEYLRERGEDVEKLSINFAKNPDGSLCDYDKAVKIVEEYPGFAVVSSIGDIEVTDVTATKGTALMKLGEYLGIEREEIAAFGDSGNDADMLRRAGIGIAMANSDDEAKAAADIMTLSNEEDGVAYALEELIPNLRRL